MGSSVHRTSSRRWLANLVGASAFFFAILQAGAVIDATLQMQLGNPTGATAAPTNHLHYLIQHPQYALDYSDTNRQPNWVSWDLTSSDVGSSGRTDAWAVETNVPPDFHPVPTSTFGSVDGQSYDRGHMCPSADRTDAVTNNEMTFVMSNIIPQASQNNQGLWATFENYSRTLLSTQELLIISGPSNFGTNRIASGGHGAIASNVWKIVVCVPLGAGTALSRITNADPASIRVIAMNTPNNSSVSGHSWTEYRTSVKQLQQVTGFSFFTALPSNLAWVLRSKVDGQTPAAPGFISFSPFSGAVNSTVTITGPNLDSTTNVTFNGIGASYTITATNQITAIAPAGAASGLIGVKTLGGTATSSSSFTVVPLTPIESWRLQWFGTTANSGAAADAAITTSDGMPNLLKYAFGLNPLVPVVNPAVGDISTGYLRLTLPKNPEATDVTFFVEVAGDVTGPWTTNGTAIDQNTPGLLQVHDNTPISSVARDFIRLRVSRP